MIDIDKRMNLTRARFSWLMGFSQRLPLLVSPMQSNLPVMSPSPRTMLGSHAATAVGVLEGRDPEAPMAFDCGMREAD